MGKAKPRHKNRKHKSQPSGIQIPNSIKDSNECEVDEPSSSNSYDSVILNAVEEVQSSNVEEKLCGLQSLVNLAGKSEAVDGILRNRVIKTIAPLLMDNNREIRNLTAGVLRNLSASGSVEVCERLVKDDIMTPLVALFQKYNDWKPSSSNSEDSDTLLQLVNILWNLCEVDDTALKYFMSSNLLSTLLRCLDYSNVGLDLSIAACQCLNSVLEDNAAVSTTLHNHEAELINLLELSSVTNKLLFFKTLIAGIVVNLNPSVTWLPVVLAVIKEALLVDVRGTLNQLSSQLRFNDELSADTLEQLDNATMLIEAQTMALETLTNLTASQDDEMDAESEDSTSEGEEEVNGWCEADDVQPLALISSEISEGLQKHDLVSAVISKLESFPANVIEIIRSSPSSKSLSKKIPRLHCRACLCLNNLVAATDIEQFGGPDRLKDLILHLTAHHLCQFKEKANIDVGIEDTEILEAVTAAVRAIVLTLVKIGYQVEKPLNLNDLQVFMKLREFPEPRVQANIIRIVGGFGMLVVNSDLIIVKLAGNYLLEVAEKEMALWLTGEALDSLLDLFSEDCTDKVALDIGLVQRLEAIAPRLKTKMRKEKKTLGDYLSVVSTVMTNLRPFIKYKSARVNALKGA